MQKADISLHRSRDPDPFDDLGERSILPLGLFLQAIWWARGLVVTITALTLALGVFYLVGVADKQYQADATIGPVINTDTPVVGAGLSQLAANALGAGGSNSDIFNKYVQVLTSTRLAFELEKNHHVIERLYCGYDADKQIWRHTGCAMGGLLNFLQDKIGWPRAKQPSPQMLADMLQQMLNVRGDETAALLSMRNQIKYVSLKYHDREYTIELLNYVLQDADNMVRQDQLVDTRNRISFLEQSLKATTDVNLQDTIRNLMLNQERSLMSLKVDKFYAVDVIDTPNADLRPVSPNSMIVLLVSILAGISLSLVVVYVILQREIAQSAGSGASPLSKPAPNVFTPLRGLLPGSKLRS